MSQAKTSQVTEKSNSTKEQNKNVELSFDNGVKFKSIYRDYTNTISLVVFIKGGLFRETAVNGGVGNLFANTWIKSTPLMQTAEFYGGAVNSGLSHDYFDFSLSIPTSSFDKLLPDLKKQFGKVTLSPEIFAQEKEITLSELEAEKDDPNGLAFQQFMEATYQDHPYALNPYGTIKSVTKINLKDVERYYSKHLPSGDMLVVLAGNYSAEQMEEIQKIFKTVPKGEPLKLSCADADIKKSTSATVSDNRIQQAKLFVAYTAPAASSPDYIYAKVLNEVLGGGMSSPYFTALRKEKGYAYSVGSMYPSRLCASRIIGHIGLQEENIDDAIATMKSINKNMAKVVTDAELEKAKNHIIGQLLVEAETNNRRAWYAAFFANLGMGFDHMDRYVDMIRKLKKEDLQKVQYLFDKPDTIFIYKGDEKSKSAQ